MECLTNTETINEINERKATYVDSSSAHLTENKYKDSPEMFGHFKYYMTEEDYNLINSFYYKNTYSIGSGVYTFKPLFYNDSLIMITLFLNAESPFQSIDETLGLINKKYGQPEYDDYIKSQVMIDWRTSESTKIKAIKNYKTKSQHRILQTLPLQSFGCLPIMPNIKKQSSGQILVQK